MQLDDFDYELPAELIAQEPLARRDTARLMLLDRVSGALGERSVAAFPDLLNHGDLLVLNDTRVIPARLLGRKESGGRVEIFLVRRSPEEGECWLCLLRSSKPSRPGTCILLADGMTATVTAQVDEGTWTVSFAPAGAFPDWLERHGQMPLPPYIRRGAKAHDRERYQTVFARQAGAVAAPTAGLHFTPELLDAVRSRGVTVATLTLHVGLGTFQPVRVDNILEHRMHREFYQIPEETAREVARRKREGGRIVTVGTTTTRALEHASREDGTVRAGTGEADIFIYPGYRFRVVDALLTNFHLPKSTLLMLVSAFAGKERVFAAYEEAIRRGFRFFSYGDAMFIY
jgi:S-adenosylmethionine:tRNA ribosyltransferase-isomerase